MVWASVLAPRGPRSIGLGRDSGGSELVISSFGNMGEVEVGSPIVNIVPRTGGNMFSGTFYADGANGAMSSDNTKALVASGVLRAPTR